VKTRELKPCRHSKIHEAALVGLWAPRRAAGTYKLIHPKNLTVSNRGLVGNLKSPAGRRPTWRVWPVNDLAGPGARDSRGGEASLRGWENTLVDLQARGWRGPRFGNISEIGLADVAVNPPEPEGLDSKEGEGEPGDHMGTGFVREKHLAQTSSTERNTQRQRWVRRGPGGFPSACSKKGGQGSSPPAPSRKHRGQSGSDDGEGTRDPKCANQRRLQVGPAGN